MMPGNYVLLLIVGLTLAAQSVRGGRSCDSRFIKFDKNCYFFGTIKKSWDAARQECQNLGADLVAIETYAEDNFIYNQILSMSASSKLSGYWTSGSLVQEGQWEWQSTSRSINSYTRWNPGQPDSPSRQRCLCLYKGFTYYWDDFQCTGEMGFICEKAGGGKLNSN
ncbi:perlucin-like protein [Lingula anatina]|uniref:Perlucin-like protein n=1 Tax=Lingula anatina TaxID=7574 RepID=A0A1S3J653_LINAN|nr:perlucin-like protein [Lingula anatina]|eukprot:XP_013405788.1 perlucin-like protein [Lingula anatina]